MYKRMILVAFCLMFSSAFAVNGSHNSPYDGFQPENPSNNGRYQMQVDNGSFYLADTQNGTLWRWSGEWKNVTTQFSNGEVNQPGSPSNTGRYQIQVDNGLFYLADTQNGSIWIWSGAWKKVVPQLSDMTSVDHHNIGK